MTRYPGYALVRRLMSRRRPIFEAIEQREPWRRVALAPGDARDVLAAEVAALRPQRALQLAGGSGDGAARAALRELCENIAAAPVQGRR